ncbi:MAG: helix-turn-helix transcriptional regulator [Acetobacteraceae bacterium]|nr:helix-turn-helix transcriptional regulator [Acetobacteraceae bacterium]
MARRKTGPDPQRLALDLYAAVLDGRGLDGPLAAIAAALDAPIALSQRVDRTAATPVQRALVGNVNIDPAMMAAYGSTWIAHDPWLARPDAHRPGVHNMSRVVSPRDLVRTRFWNEFLLHHEPTVHGLTIQVDEPDAVRGMMTFWRGTQGEAFGEPEESLLHWLRPHLERAFVAEARLGLVPGAVAAVDALPQGVAVLAKDGAPILINRALRAMLAGADGLALAPRGLAAASRSAQAALDRAITLALAVSAGMPGLLPGEEGRVLLPRPSGGAPWMVQVLPLAAGTQGPFGTARGAVVLVGDAEARRAPSEAALVRAFGLTPSEAALALSLAQGRSLAEHARHRRISLHTARTHLARIYAKTGCRRQAELVARLAAFAA